MFDFLRKLQEAGEKLMAGSGNNADDPRAGGLDVAATLEGEAGMKRLALRFVGQVQGVGFRWTAMSVARRLGLTGWVRNEPDGSVTMEIQGEASHVGAFFSQMLEEYRRRPISYTVDEREDIALVEGETGFEVIY